VWAPIGLNGIEQIACCTSRHAPAQQQHCHVEEPAPLYDWHLILQVPVCSVPALHARSQATHSQSNSLCHPHHPPNAGRGCHSGWFPGGPLWLLRKAASQEGAAGPLCSGAHPPQPLPRHSVTPGLLRQEHLPWAIALGCKTQAGSHQQSGAG
jgi:hypothetical protein